MRWKCRERFPRHRSQRILLVSNPIMHHGTCVTHMTRCMSGSLTCGCWENIPGIPGAYATLNFRYLARGPLTCEIDYQVRIQFIFGTGSGSVREFTHQNRGQRNRGWYSFIIGTCCEKTQSWRFQSQAVFNAKVIETFYSVWSLSKLRIATRQLPVQFICM